MNRPELSVEKANELFFSALANTDRESLYRSIKQIGSCLEVDISPILGVGLVFLNEDARYLWRAVLLVKLTNTGLVR